MPGKVNTSGLSGNPWEQVWLLTLNSLWSARLPSKNRWHLGNLQTYTGKGTHSQTLIHAGKLAGNENKSPLTLISEKKNLICVTVFYPQHFICRDPFSVSSLITFYGGSLLRLDFSLFLIPFIENPPTTRLQKLLLLNNLSMWFHNEFHVEKKKKRALCVSQK